MKYLFLSISILFSALHCRAQFGYDTLKIFFPLNESLVNNEAKKIIDAAAKIIGTKNILIYGYADYLGNEPSNMELAARRANNVRMQLLLKKIKPTQILICEGIGEVKREEIDRVNGFPADRRVAIFIKRDNEIMNKAPTETTSKIKVNEINTEGKLIPIKSEKANIVEPDTGKVKSVKKLQTKEKEINLKVPSISRFDELSELKPNDVMRIENIQFQPTRHYILKESEPILGELLKTLLDYPNLKIRIEGHVCCIKGEGDALDTDTYELKLSENRAHFIYDYLIGYGIDAKRLEYIGFGKRKPIVAIEKTQEDAQKNRRVEIRVLSN